MSSTDTDRKSRSMQPDGASSVQYCRSRLHTLARTRAAIPWSTQLCHRLAWSPTSPFCLHQPSGSAAGKVDHRRQPGFLGWRRTRNDLPDDVTSATFRQRLKTHLFTSRTGSTIIAILSLRHGGQMVKEWRRDGDGPRQQRQPRTMTIQRPRVHRERSFGVPGVTKRSTRDNRSSATTQWFAANVPR